MTQGDEHRMTSQMESKHLNLKEYTLATVDGGDGRCWSKGRNLQLDMNWSAGFVTVVNNKYLYSWNKF